MVTYEIGNPGSQPVTLVQDWDPADPLADPGDLLTTTNGNGVTRVRGGTDAVFLQGAGYREDFRPRPFLDRIPLDGSGAARLFESSADMHERPLVGLDETLGRHSSNASRRAASPTRGCGVARTASSSR